MLFALTGFTMFNVVLLSGEIVDLRIQRLELLAHSLHSFGCSLSLLLRLLQLFCRFVKSTTILKFLAAKFRFALTEFFLSKVRRFSEADQLFLPLAVILIKLVRRCFLGLKAGLSSIEILCSAPKLRFTPSQIRFTFVDSALTSIAIRLTITPLIDLSP